MLADKLTVEIVSEYTADLMVYADARLITKPDVKSLLDFGETTPQLTEVTNKIFWVTKKLGIDDPREFIETAAISIPLPNRRFIYVPWEVGSTTDFSLAKQVEIIAHEATHTTRSALFNDWIKEYIISFSQRCTEERIAYQASLEVFYLLHGRLPSFKSIMAYDNRYFLRPTDERVLIAGLTAVAPAINQGDRATTIGKWSARWFADKGLR